MKTDVTSRVHGNVVPRGNSVCCSALARLRSVALLLTIMLTAGMAFGQNAVREATQHAADLSQMQEPVVIVKHEPYPGPDVVPAEVQAMMANHTQSSITPMNDPAPVIDHCPEDRVVECFSDVGHTVGELEYSIFCGPAALIIVYEPAGILETGSCPGTEYTVTYAVWDQCGSHTTCDQIFTLDNAGPQITFCPEGGIINNPDEAAPDVDAVLYEVSCTDDTLCAVIDVTVEVDSTFDVCTGWTFTNTYTITDGCGRTDQCVQVFEIPPAPLSITCPSEEIVSCPEDIVFNPDGLLIEGLIPGVEYTIESEGPTLIEGAGPCDGAVYELVYNIEDECGRTASCTQTFLIVNDGPTIEGPEDITVDCGESIDPEFTGMATANDPCQGALDVTYDDEVISDMCPQVIERTFTATNVCGAEVSYVQTITIEDNTAPVLSVPADVSVGCNDSTDPQFTGSATATDDCHNVEISYTDGLVTGSCPESFERTWTAVDECGNVSTGVQVISIVDNDAPIITCPDDITVDCAASLDPEFTGIATATDECSDVEVSYVDGDIEGECEQTFVRTWTATDACGNTSTCEQIITIVDTTAPTIFGPEDVTVDCTDSLDPDFTGFATAEDDCNEVEITYVDGDIVGECEQTMVRTWTATDACGNSSTYEQTITIVDVTAPVISCPDDISVSCVSSFDPEFTGFATATDDCNAVEVTYEDGPITGAECQEFFVRTWTAVDACGNASTCEQTITIVDDVAPVISCPDDITVDCDASLDPEFTGFATATDECSSVDVSYVDGVIEGECEQTMVRTWTATDACGNTSTCEQIITIVDTTAPTIFGPEDVTVDCTDSLDPDFTGFATAEDDCNEVEISYVDGDIMGDCEQTMVRTWTATDACGNSSTYEQTITIVDVTAPVISCPDDISVSCVSSFDPEFTGFATATDDCNAVEVTYEDGPITGAECQEFFVRTWTAVDACGNASTCEQTITIVDDVAPVISCPDDITVDCDASLDPEFTGFATATDECSSVDVTYVDGVIEGECEQTMVRTWTATDACGNTSTCEQIITIVDTTAPTIFGPEDVTVDCTDSLDPDATGFATAEDDCNEVEITYEDGDIVGECEQTMVRTWTATDACGNSSTYEQTITIVDETAPVITCPDDITVSCESSLDPEVTGMATATDDCNTVDITYFDTWVSESCPSVIERTFTATDLCGNTSSCTQTITITYDLPTISAPADAIVECESDVVPNYDGVEYTTACNLSGEVTAEVILSDDGSCPGAEHTIVYTVTDGCGRTATATQTFTIDNDGPSIEDLPEMEVECVDDVVANFDDLVVNTACDLGYEATAGEPVLLEGEDSCNGAAYSITYTVVDECGRSAEATQIFHIVNDGLVITSAPEDMVVSCYEDIVPNPFAVEYTAPCSSDVFIIVTPPTQMCCDHGCPGAEYVVKYTVSDQCGNEEILFQTFTIDNDGPVILSCGENVDVESADEIVVSADDVVYETSCGVEAEVSVNPEPEVVDNGCAGIDYIYEYTVTDICGRTAVCYRTFTVPNNDPDCYFEYCYGDFVHEYLPGTQLNGSPIPPSRTDGNNALGTPERTDAEVFATLGYGGSLTIGFELMVVNGPGNDIEIVETSYGNEGCEAYPEYADVYLSQNGVDFFFARTVCKSDPYVDISDAGAFDWIRYVRLVNNDALTSTPDGYDVDGIVALQECVPFEEPGTGGLIAEEHHAFLTAFPNPTSGDANIVFRVPTETKATLEVFDMSGRIVQELFAETAAADLEYNIDFDTSDLPSGIYVYRLKTSDEVIVKKIMIER